MHAAPQPLSWWVLHCSFSMPVSRTQMGSITWPQVILCRSIWACTPSHTTTQTRCSWLPEWLTPPKMGKSCYHGCAWLMKSGNEISPSLKRRVSYSGKLVLPSPSPSRTCKCCLDTCVLLKYPAVFFQLKLQMISYSFVAKLVGQLTKMRHNCCLGVENQG